MNSGMILASVSEIDDSIRGWGTFVKDIYVHPGIFFPCLTILTIACFVRGILWKDVLSKQFVEKSKKRIHAYIFDHCIAEWIISLVFSYLIIKLTYADITNYIINYAIAPAIGFMIAIGVDYRFIIPLEKNINFSDGLMKTKKDKSNDASGPSGVNIIVNTNSNEHESHEEHTHDIVPTTHKDYISEDELNSAEDSDEIFRVAINELIDHQYQHGLELEKQSRTLEAIRETMMIDKKFKLKNLMYKCLDQGYATPDQNDVIVDMYRTYLELGGNGEIKELYEKHYLMLSVHYDRRSPDRDKINRERRERYHTDHTRDYDDN